MIPNLDAVLNMLRSRVRFLSLQIFLPRRSFLAWLRSFQPSFSHEAELERLQFLPSLPSFTIVQFLNLFLCFFTMRQNLASSVLALAFSAASVVADGTPVLVPRASTTATPITVTGNGVCMRWTSIELRLTCAAFYQGSDRFYIRGVDYQPGTETLHNFELRPD
jgi:hypothetical protein